MKNIFATTKEYVKQPNRNVFDLSFQNNGTYNFGTLYPVFCKEVIPGDSFKIDTQFALRFLPMAFPIQTRMRANLHYFYVRNRNLWDDWKKFIGHTAETVPPFLDGSQDCFKTGGLADYLGIPTTSVGAESVRSYLQPESWLTASKYYEGLYGSYVYLDNSSPLALNSDLLGIDLKPKLTSSESSSTAHYNRAFYASFNLNTAFSSLSTVYSFNFTAANTISSDTLPYRFGVCRRQGNTSVFIGYSETSIPYPVGVDTFDLNFNTPLSNWNFYSFGTKSFNTISELNDFLHDNFPTSEYDVFLQPTGISHSHVFNGYSPAGPTSISALLNSSYYLSSSNTGYSDLSDIDSTANPFLSTNNINIPISALPFRAYESIYNAFYRNEQNDPLMIDGQPEYDKYCPNTTSGSDDFPYKLYNRNWELDYLTSAVQSPQQGIAPLVGVSQSGDFTFVNRDSNGNVGYFTAKANLSSDGQSITGFQLSDNVELSDIPLTETPNSDVPDSVKRGTVYTLNQMALAGISINDFRNVNALQRWLETNIRRGYKYVDQIKSHFGVDVAYNVLDMPEFIGGVSEPVYINQVNQTTETETDPLGSYAGQASVMASSNHAVEHYCDEHGFIIGIFSVVPVPNYSQLLPKHFIKDNYLDYFFPEFGHIGMQPIDYREVCPLQQYGVNPSGLNDTFGYQRAWYDYISSVDEIHGLFRTNLRNFVLNRQFDTLPRLNKDFLQVDANQLNDVFTVQDISDKILGQIHFNVIAKRPIPKFGIPRLE